VQLQEIPSNTSNDRQVNVVQLKTTNCPVDVEQPTSPGVDAGLAGHCVTNPHGPIAAEHSCENGQIVMGRNCVQETDNIHSNIVVENRDSMELIGVDNRSENDSFERINISDVRSIEDRSGLLS